MKDNDFSLKNSRLHFNMSFKNFNDIFQLLLPQMTAAITFFRSGEKKYVETHFLYLKYSHVRYNSLKTRLRKLSCLSHQAVVNL